MTSFASINSTRTCGRWHAIGKVFGSSLIYLALAVISAH